MQNYKEIFTALSDFAFNVLEDGEHMAFSFFGEQSLFMRFNGAKVRQIGNVEQLEAALIMWKNSRTYNFSLTLSGTLSEDKTLLEKALHDARTQCALLPQDPYQTIPTANESSEAVFDAALLKEEDIVKTVLDPVSDLDFTGLYTQGTVYRGSSNSAGAKHWFETKNFVLDFSVWLENGRAVKSSYAGTTWSDDEYKVKINFVRQSLLPLQNEQKKLSSGKYRAFISADALHEFATFFSWNGLGERGMREGESAFIPLREGRECFSEQFTVSQDFSLGGEPAFNTMGEVSDEKLVLIQNGKLVNTIINSRTAKEYGLTSNGADEGEGVRSLCIAGGSLEEDKILEALGTGIYVSNFHYLNWSDVQNARITGMTRFACLWVENGKIVAPISDMRWDDSLYNLFGAKLQAITSERHLFPETSTYERREVGSCLLPGILVSELNCTL